MEKTNTKYIFVTGGVISGVGKGIAAASMGAILKGKGLKVSIQKCDPYLNQGLYHSIRQTLPGTDQKRAFGRLSR